MDQDAPGVEERTAQAAAMQRRAEVNRNGAMIHGAVGAAGVVGGTAAGAVSAGAGLGVAIAAPVLATGAQKAYERAHAGEIAGGNAAQTQLEERGDFPDRQALKRAKDAVPKKRNQVAPAGVLTPAEERGALLAAAQDAPRKAQVGPEPPR